MDTKTKRDVCHTVVIAPYYEDSAAEQFCKELSKITGKEDRLIIVDDGSTNLPFSGETFERNGLSGNVVTLVRNVGHQAAIACGIGIAIDSYDFERLVVMDSDGEDQPNQIPTLIGGLAPDTASSQTVVADVVVASRKSRRESIEFRLFYWVYKLFFSLFVGRKIRFGNFMAMTRAAATRLVHHAETPMHLAASVIHSKLRMVECPIDRGERYSGSSKMNLVSLTLHGLRSIMVFAEDVLVRITLFCAASAALITGAMATMVVFKILGLAIPGWFSTVSGILLLLLLQLAIITLLVLLSAGNLRSRSASSFDYTRLISTVLKIEPKNNG